MTIRGVSPGAIAVRAPEEVVLEVFTVGGGYVRWTRNGVLIELPSSAFLHFGEIYHIPSTTANDIGILYHAGLAEDMETMPTDSDLIPFIVTAPGMQVTSL